jgi:hypothetical protein
MAAVTAAVTAEAEAARRAARRLRNEAEGLKLATRDSLACSRRRLDQARLEAERARTKQAEPMPSPWSELRWTHDDAALAGVLLAVPSG